MVAERVYEAVLDSFSFTGGRRVVPVPASVLPEHLGGLIDFIRGKGDFGNGGFSADELDLIREAELVVVPELTRVAFQIDDENGHTCGIDLTLKILGADYRWIMNTLLVEAEGVGDTEQGAVDGAAELLSREIEEKIRALPVFDDTSGIVEVLDDRNIILSLGKGDMVEPGDEFRIIGPGSNGLLLIEDVSDSVSYGYVVYTGDAVTLETKLEKIDRFGVDLSIYGHPMISVIEDTIPFSSVFGIKGIPSKRFPRLRPFLCLEVPVHQNLDEWPGFPVNFLAGIEVRRHIGKFQIIPSTSIGLGLIVPTQATEELLLSHLGNSLEVQFSMLVHPDVMVFISTGYRNWFRITMVNLSATGYDDYGGIIIGAGIQIKL